MSKKGGFKMIKLLELFSGYGGASFALKKTEIEHECVGYSDIEKCANYIYQLNHGKDIPQLGDVTKINPEELEDFDLLTGGFPCQSFSIAGKREGFAAKDKGNLFFEIIRIAYVKKPRYMLLENVQGLLSHDNGDTFEICLKELQKIGYHVKWKLLFSKELGTPQNRPRVWFMCFKDKKDYYKFMFSEKEELKIFIIDLLEKVVDDKYYLTDKQLKRFNESTRYGNHKISYFNTISPTICSIGKSDVAIIPDDISFVNYAASPQRRNGAKKSKIISTLLSRDFYAIKEKQKRWRRLTPKECFRLQGFFNDEIKFGDLSDHKLYFLAGNGWDINVASKIFTQLFKGNKNKQKCFGDFL